jgi:hypothetical protein
MNAYATVAHIYCIGDGRRRCWTCRCGGNARNRVCRLTTDMCITQGQAAFVHNVKSIITYSNKVKTLLKRYCWTRLFNARRTNLLRSSNTHKYIFCESFQFPHYSGQVEPQCQATHVEFDSPHEAICAGFVDVCIPILPFY